MRISISKFIKSPLIRNLAYGLSSLLVKPVKGTGGTSSAEYCYSVYLRHLVVAHSNGLQSDPEVVAEIGPGDSLGIGLTAMLAGAEQYIALDVVDHADAGRNLLVFDRLVELFQGRTAIPAGGEFEAIQPNLETYEFPEAILTEERLREALHPDRIDRIRSILTNGSISRSDSPIRYLAPLTNLSRASLDSVDMVISQAAMEHLDDLAEAYDACFRWLRPGGFMSHQIDFRCHDTAREWNGHWAYSDPIWKVIRGARPWLLNRHCYSEHLEMIGRAGFIMAYTGAVKEKDGIRRSQLAPRFRTISDGDLLTSNALIQARKPSIF